MNKLRLFQPYLFALYPYLWAYSANLSQLQFPMIIRPLIFLIIFTTIILLVNKLIYKNWDKATVITSFLMILLLDYGYYQRFPKDILFWGISINRHLIIIFIWLVFFAILTSSLLWKRARPNVVSSYMTILGLVLIILPLRFILQYGYLYIRDPLTYWQPTKSPSPESLEQTLEFKPDIYYIILDGYARADILQEIYHFDNSDLINFLKDHGFYIAHHSQSNYSQTALALASSLNFDYLDFLPKESLLTGNRLPLQKLIQDSTIRSYLNEMGYRFVPIASSYYVTDIKDADEYMALDGPSLNSLESLLFDTSFFKAPIEIFDLTIPFSGYDHHRSVVLFNFHALHELAGQAGPKFVFAHIVAPHPPFVFDEHGNPTNRHLIFTFIDGKNPSLSSDEYREGYIEQLMFINDQLKQSVENILMSSDEPPIIIIQADHGPGLYYDQGSKENTCLLERTSILNAYFLPGDQSHDLYPSITPVNTFRLLLDNYFDTELGLLEDKVYYAPWSHPYNFIDVSEESKLPCAFVNTGNKE